MTRLAAALALAACCVAPAARAAPAPGPLVAVLEFRNRLPEEQKAAVGERLRFAALVRTRLAVQAPRAKVMTLDEMQRLAAANPDALDKCNDESCLEVGKLLGADAVVEGVFRAAGNKLEASLRLYDVRKGGEPVAQQKVAAKSGDLLLKAVGEAAARLARKLPAPAAAAR